MTLIASISGIRGTIGGKRGDALTPVDIVNYTTAFAKMLSLQNAANKKVVIGRDARVSGAMVSQLVCGTLIGMGFDVVDLGLATTPTVEMAVTEEQAAGGIILTASHNPAQWNALKLLNAKGEFISADDGARMLEIAKQQDYEFASVDKIGSYNQRNDALDKHIEAILALPLVDAQAIANKNFKIAIDAVNSVGGIAVPRLLKALGVNDLVEMYCEPTGLFPHNPEPLPENLNDIAQKVKDETCDLGIVVDPDVDRLCFVCEDGSMFGEEYTLVAVADYVLQNKKGNTVSNLSSTKALRDVTEKHGGKHSGAAVGEVNVVKKMKETNAVIGGEGNGGIIYPDLHYGRDALVGIALFLSHLAKQNVSAKQLRDGYPDYFISKNKIELKPETDVDNVLVQMKKKYSHQPVNTEDGLKIEFKDNWVHLRKSNTEPIIRIYAESKSEREADELAKQVMKEIAEIG